MTSNDALIWLHEYSLRLPTKLPLSVTSEQPKIYCFIWDDAYLRQQNYSLKRLVFIYESLTQLPINIFQGDTINILQQRPEKEIYIESTSYPPLQEKIKTLEEYKTVKIIPAETWVNIPANKKYQRFFQYWKNAEKQLIQK